MWLADRFRKWPHPHPHPHPHHLASHPMALVVLDRIVSERSEVWLVDRWLDIMGRGGMNAEKEVGESHEKQKR
jgi:hypothetical protein